MSISTTTTATTTEIWSLHGGAATAPGHRRRHNQDAATCGPDWFAVADGMGGHRGGELASGLAIEEVRAAPAPAAVADVRALVDRANARIRDVATRESATGMGTTVVAAARLGDAVTVVSLGDSRCYRLLDGDLTLATRDHSHVQEMVDLGRIAPGDVGRHPMRHVVTRALGVDSVPRPDVCVLRPPVGRLLLCSDGLSSELAPRTIGRVLSGIGDAQAAADRLVALAQARDARDDVTAVVVDVSDGSA